MQQPGNPRPLERRRLRRERRHGMTKGTLDPPRTVEIQAMMTRSLLGATAVATLLFCTGPSPAAEAKRTNILFCFADDWGRYASAYAAVDGRPSLNQVIKTPNVDRIAREGVLFRNAFVNAPSCTPCRSSLLTGRHFLKCGRASILQGAVWDGSIPAFPLQLQEAGYHIGKSYKVWSPGTPADAPIGGQRHAYEKAGRAPNKFCTNATRLMKDGLTLAAARDKIYGQVRDNFDAFLAARKAGQPWFYWFGPTNPHRTWMRGSGKTLWGIDPDSLRGKLPAFLPDVPEVREDVADYLGECQAFDAYIGVLLKRLEQLGELDNTLVVISGDHGMPGVPQGKCNLYDHGIAVALAVRGPGGKAGRVVDDFVSLPDLAPTFLEVGGVKPPAGLYGRSLMPVLRSEKSGQVDPQRTWVVAGRERHVAAAREENRPYPMRCLRTRDFLYIRNFAPDRWPMGTPTGISETKAPDAAALTNNTFAAFGDMDASPTKAWVVEHRNDPKWKPFYDRAFGKRPAEELYDLRKDPDQVKNLAGAASYAAERKDMADRLTKILTDARDPRVVEKEPMFERPPFTDPVGKRKPKPKK
jgi:arylsulfatase A-like enzyme